MSLDLEKPLRCFVALLVFAAVLTAGLPIEMRSQTRSVQTSTMKSPVAEAERQRVAFEENRGQFDQRVKFTARTGNSMIFLTAEEAVYVLPFAGAEDSKNLAYALRMKFAGAKENIAISSDSVGEQTTNYFKNGTQ